MGEWLALSALWRVVVQRRRNNIHLSTGWTALLYQPGLATAVSAARKSILRADLVVGDGLEPRSRPAVDWFPQHSFNSCSLCTNDAMSSHHDSLLAITDHGRSTHWLWDERLKGRSVFCSTVEGREGDFGRTGPPTRANPWSRSVQGIRQFGVWGSTVDARCDARLGRGGSCSGLALVRIRP